MTKAHADNASIVNDRLICTETSQEEHIGSGVPSLPHCQATMGCVTAWRSQFAVQTVLTSNSLEHGCQVKKAAMTGGPGWRGEKTTSPLAARPKVAKFMDTTTIGPVSCTVSEDLRQCSLDAKGEATVDRLFLSRLVPTFVFLL